MAYRTCSVSFDDHGVRRTVQVSAETAYEAAVLALKAFAEKRYIKGPRKDTVLELEVQAPRRLRVTVGAVLGWLYESTGHSRDQAERKKRLRLLLSDDWH
jgi:hypothetical protein